MTAYPEHYDLKIETDFETLTFEGLTKIYLNSETECANVVLQASDLNIESCVLIKDGKEKEVKFTLNQTEEELKIDLINKTVGKFELHLKYNAKLEDNLKGLYLAKYKIDGEIRTGALTQFETDDARRAFPCFDEPKYKATFDIELIIDENNSAISNTPIVTKQPNGLNKVSYKFERTPIMSTYLLFIGIAEFESIEDKYNDIIVRIITHPGLIKYGEDALDFGKKSLKYCEEYFKIPYPLPKLDMIASPAVAAGAMENWGAILYRENALLKFPTTTTMGLISIRSTIAHEITHMWFGNLVSPSLWKYLWLNESFATFFAYKIMDHYFPELSVWDFVVSGSTGNALVADAYIETVPIEIKAEKKSSFNIKSIPIVYSKGGAILRQVEGFIGKDMLEKGLELYLKKHEFDVASSDDLWTALEEVSSKPVSKLMSSWVLQDGYPLVTVKRDRNSLTFNQKRFTYLENSDNSLWMIPISVLFFKESGERQQKHYLLETEEVTFDVGFEFKAFKVNVGHEGFYRVQYDKQDLKRLGDLVKQDSLSILDSWNLENDVFGLFKAGMLHLNDYLGFITNYTDPKLYTSISAISNQLVNLFNLSEGKNKNKISNVGVSFHEAVLENIGFSPKDSDAFHAKIMRNGLLLNANYIGSQKVIDFGLKMLASYKSGIEIPSDILDAVLSIGARHTNDFDWYLNKFETAQNEVEIIHIGNSFGEFSDSHILDKVLEEILFTKIPQRNRSRTVARLCANPHSINKLWKFYLANLDNIEKLNEWIQISSLNEIVSNSVSEDTKKDMKNFFKDYVKRNSIAKETTGKSFETLEINFKMKSYLK